jgi:hypothetical protein
MAKAKLGQALSRAETESAREDARTPILDGDGTVISWRPGPSETAQRERELAAVFVNPEDYVSAGAYLSDCLFDESLAALDGEALLAHFEAHRPDAILDEDGARWQAWRGDTRHARR